MILNFFLLIILITLSAFFSGSETAFFSLSSVRLERLRLSDNKNDNLVASLISKPQKLLVGILVGNMLVNISATTIATSMAISLLGDKGMVLSILLMTFFILIFGEVFPKTLAVKHNVRFSTLAAMPISIILFIITPFRLLMEWIARLFLKNIRKDEKIVVDEKDLRGLVYQEGHFSYAEKETILRILEIDQIPVSEFARPAHQYLQINKDSSKKEAMDSFRNSHQHFALVFQDEPQRIVGVLFLDDILFSTPGVGIEKLVFCPYLFSGEEKLLKVLSVLKSQHREVAFVIQNDGTVSGLIEASQVLDWIFVEPVVEEDREQKFARIGEIYLCPGSISLSEFDKIFEANFQSGKYSTLAGFVVESLGRIPNKGEEFEIGKYHFWVIKKKGTQILLLGVKTKVQ
ncbi:DUF21 domain-containing protein [bacterium]|nr:DUF21 domain-containing protein [bacterium]